MDPPGAQAMLASGFTQERNPRKGIRSPSRRLQSSDSARKLIRAALEVSDIQAVGETTVHREVAALSKQMLLLSRLLDPLRRLMIAAWTQRKR